jgi:hypothetical protein
LASWGVSRQHGLNVTDFKHVQFSKTHQLHLALR